jgi:cation diffusion facilitator family transporter
MTNAEDNGAAKPVYLSIAGNVTLAVIKGVAGILGNSYALLADAIESTCDIFSTLLVLLGLKYSRIPPDKNHPYGHGKVEPIITFVIGSILVASATVIAIQSIHHIILPHPAPKPYTLIVIGIAIVVKEIIHRITKRVGKRIKSTSISADAWHHRSDAITSACVFAGILITLVGGKKFVSADGWAAMVASLFIYYNSYLIFRPAVEEIMDEQVYDDLVSEIRSVAIKVPGVINTEKCLVRKSGMKFNVDLHVTVDANITVKKGHEIAHLLKDALLKEINQLADVLIHIEPNE